PDTLCHTCYVPNTWGMTRHTVFSFVFNLSFVALLFYIFFSTSSDGVFQRDDPKRTQRFADSYKNSLHHALFAPAGHRRFSHLNPKKKVVGLIFHDLVINRLFFMILFIFS